MQSDFYWYRVRRLLGLAFFVGCFLVQLPVSAAPSRTLWQPLPVEDDIFAVVTDDVDGDGRLDLIVTRRAYETAQVLWQKEPRQFESGPIAKILGFHANELSRLPGEKPRYILSAEGTGKIKILIPDQQGGLLQWGASYPFSGSYATIPFNWPEWGVSLAVTPYQGEGLTILRDFKAETAKAHSVYDLGVLGHSVPGVVSVADVDGDGIPELFYTTRRSRSLWRINYPGKDQKPEPSLVWTAPVGAPRHLVMTDLTDDGMPDILLPLESERRIASLINDGRGHFTPGPELTVPSKAWGPARLAVAQSRDGKVLLVADTEQSLMFYQIEKGNPFHYQVLELPIDASLSQLQIRDLDGDDELDVIAVLSVTQNSLRVLYGPLWPGLTQKLGPAITDSTLAAAAAEDKIKVQEDPKRVVATIGDRAITVGEVRRFVMESGTGHDLQNSRGQVQTLTRILEQVLLEKAVAREAGLAEPLSFEQMKSGLKTLEEKHFPLPDVPDEAALRTYYETNKEDYGIPEMVRLVQIQFRRDKDRTGGLTAQQRAEQALKRLQSGDDFKKLAVELSENPLTRSSGDPDRGFVARNAEPWLRDGLRNLQPGQRTGIVESPAGYEIILIRDWRAPLLADFAKVQTQVENRWRLEQQQQARRSYLKTLAQQFKVVVLDKDLESANPANQK